jgi:DNA polymerase-3 subunit delta'
MYRKALLLNYQVLSLVYIQAQVKKFKLENFAPFINGNNIHDIFKELADAMYHIEHNANAKIILTDLSIKLACLIHKKNEQHYLDINFSFFGDYFSAIQLLQIVLLER